MCLDKITGYKQDPTLTIQVWKLGRFVQTYLLTGIMNFHIPVGRWVKDESDAILSIDQGSRVYESGFHCYVYETKLSKRFHHKCFVRKIVATGERGGEYIAVAREIYIPNPKAPIWKRDWWIRHFGIHYLPKEKV